MKRDEDLQLQATNPISEGQRIFLLDYYNSVRNVLCQDRQIDPQYPKNRKRWIQRPQMPDEKSIEDDTFLDFDY